MNNKNLGPKSLEYEIDSEGLNDFDTEPETLSKEPSDDAEKTRLGVIKNSKRVRLRSSPSMTTMMNVIGVLDAGTIVEILRDSHEFYKVKLDDGKKGYVHKDYCQEV